MTSSSPYFRTIDKPSISLRPRPLRSSSVPSLRIPLSVRFLYEFLGLIESPSDGLGVWTLPDATIAGLVTNATFPSFLKLCEGGCVLFV